MNHFAYRNGRLHAESVDLADIVQAHGSPVFVYSRATIEQAYRAFTDALDERDYLICYAVKANSNLAVLSVLANLGAGFDIVSIGELHRVLRAGGRPDRIVFSGVGKRDDEIIEALQIGIRCFNVESEWELNRLSELAQALGVTAPVSLRVNPDVDAQTHPYISTGLKENKFGIAIDRAALVYRLASELPAIQPVGIDCHIGSQLTQTAPFVDALKRVLVLVDELSQQGVHLKHLDIGGGLGVRYADETPPSAAEYIDAIAPLIQDYDLELVLEPGRAIMANAGVLLTRVLGTKYNGDHHFVIVDAAMTELMRPALYQAWHDILPLQEIPTVSAQKSDVVGPVCETGDFLARDRMLAAEANDLLAVMSAGAYAFVMSSNYNSRPRPPEIMVDGDKLHLARERETLDDLMRGEHPLSESGQVAD